jgi:hypothetical protein
MAGADGMAIEEVVGKVLVDEHADVLRESVEWLAGQLMRSRSCATRRCWIGRGVRPRRRAVAAAW